MLSFRPLLLALLCTLSINAVGYGDFQLNLQFVGMGSVSLLDANGTRTFSAANPLIEVNGTIGKLSASNNVLGFDKTLGGLNVTGKTINANQNLQIGLTNYVVGTSFIEWSGNGNTVYGGGTSPDFEFNQLPGADDPSVADWFATAKYATLSTNAQFIINGTSKNAVITGSNVSLDWSSFNSLLLPGGQNNLVTLVLNNGRETVQSEQFELDVFSPSSVPEPSALVLLTFAISGYVSRKRLYTRKSKTEE